MPHTPGPYLYQADSDGPAITTMDSQVIIARVYGEGMTGTQARQQNSANAQLLAAAPEMLAALKFTQKELIETRGNVTGLWARMREVERQIDSIITKAE